MSGSARVLRHRTGTGTVRTTRGSRYVSCDSNFYLHTLIAVLPAAFRKRCTHLLLQNHILVLNALSHFQVDLIKQMNGLTRSARDS